MTEYKGIKVDGKKVDEHRYVMEQHLGRPLEPNEVVHHKDGDKRNNDIDNLELTSRSEHSRMHRLGQVGTQEMRENLSKARKGKASKNRRLTQEQVERIKELAASGYTQRKIGEIIGVHHKTVWEILSRKTYVEEETMPV